MCWGIVTENEKQNNQVKSNENIKFYPKAHVLCGYDCTSIDSFWFGPPGMGNLIFKIYVLAAFMVALISIFNRKR